MFSINLPLDKKIRVFKDIYGISCCFSENLKFFLLRDIMELCYTNKQKTCLHSIYTYES